MPHDTTELIIFVPTENWQATRDKLSADGYSVRPKKIDYSNYNPNPTNKSPLEFLADARRMLEKSRQQREEMFNDLSKVEKPAYFMAAVFVVLLVIKHLLT